MGEIRVRLDEWGVAVAGLWCFVYAASRFVSWRLRYWTARKTYAEGYRDGLDYAAAAVSGPKNEED